MSGSSTKSAATSTSLKAGAFAWEPIGEAGLGWLRFERYEDDRGWLSEVFNQEAAFRFGLHYFGQDNISRTQEPGVVRGLHFQRPPAAQAKLFRVARGRVFHVAVDLRRSGFGKIYQHTLSDADAAWLYLPAGVAHGFQTLGHDVEAHFKLSHPHDPASAGAVRYDDPDLAIDWPLPVQERLISARDRAARPLADCRRIFT
jgi:dTDP-4-dehydrorhamnose 3,5-epimerase